MRRALEALGRADDVVESAERRAPKRAFPSSGEQQLVHEKLDIYMEESETDPEETPELKSSVSVVEELVGRETLPCVVVNLYPGEDSCSVLLDDKSGSLLEPVPLSCAQRDLCEYLDAEQLPPFLLEALKKSQTNYFCGGRVIAEVRDYRFGRDLDPPSYQSKHILLRPTMQTSVCAVESMTSNENQCTQDDKLALESQLILPTAEPLCLKPSVAVACTDDKLLSNKHNIVPKKRWFRGRSRPSTSLSQELSQCARQDAEDACKSFREEKTSQQHDLKVTAENYVDAWKQGPFDLDLPPEVEVEKYIVKNLFAGSDDFEVTAWPSPEVTTDFRSECESSGQQWESMKNFMLSSSDPLWGSITEPQNIASCKSQMCPRQDTPDDHSDAAVAGSDTDAGGVESVQSKAECPSESPPGSSGSARVSQCSPGTKPKEAKITVPQTSSVSKEAVKYGSPLNIPTSISGQCPSGEVPLGLQVINSSQVPPVPPIPKPACISQKSPVDLKGLDLVPPAAQRPASSSKGTAVPQFSASSTVQKVMNTVHPVQGAKGSPLPWPRLPSQPQSPFQAQSRSRSRSKSRPQPLHRPQMQPQPQPMALQLIVQQPQQTMSSPALQAETQASAQRLSSEQQASQAQQAVVISLAGCNHYLQLQTAVLSQTDSGQQRPEQSPSLQISQLPPVPQQARQRQPQPKPPGRRRSQHRYVRQVVSVASVGIQTDEDLQHEHPAGQAKGSTHTGPPAPPQS
ncbi:transcription factor SPT20 homolog [Ctenodactylus gundi]